MSRQASVHVTQHRPSKEIKPTPRERALESELKQVTRKLTQTRKELVKVEHRVVDSEIEAEEETVVTTTVSTDKVEWVCPRGCNVPFKVLDLGWKTYYVCPECTNRAPASGLDKSSAVA